MQRVTMVRYSTRPGQAEENERLSRAVFAELRATPPDGIAYALLRNGDEFIHVFLNLEADDSAKVTGIASFERFEQGMKERCETAPAVTRLAAELVESYGFSGGR